MDLFEKAIDFVLSNEGDYVNDEHDPGGETRWGISKRSHSHLNIADLSKEGAIDIYKKEYWIKYRYKEIKDKRVCVRLFDLGINIGPARAHRLIQLAVNDSANLSDVELKVDGILGSKSIEKINQCCSVCLYIFLVKKAENYYKGLNETLYIKGWLNRLHRKII